MFEKMVITGSTEKARTGYFVAVSGVAVCGLTLALVASLFAVEITLGSGNLEITELIAPVEMIPSEPEPPAEASAPPQQEPLQSAPSVPTRQTAIARIDESPSKIPKQVSTVKNTLRELPPSGYFKIGKTDSDRVAGSESGRNTGSATGNYSGLSAMANTVAKVKVTEEESPPPKKQAPPKPQRPRSLGVINGKATSLPRPVYSAAARAINAQGQVKVKIVIDENGRVVSADAVSGHPLLRNAAESAARQARFSPTLLSGEPISITGTIVYNFIG